MCVLGLCVCRQGSYLVVCGGLRLAEQGQNPLAGAGRPQNLERDGTAKHILSKRQTSLRGGGS